MKLGLLLWLLARVAAVILIVVVALLLLLQHQLIYRPRQMSPETARARASALGMEVLEFTTGQGPQLAYHVPSAGSDLERLWLVFSGNAQIAFDWVEFCRHHAQPGRGFLLIDYPGFGASAGAPSPVRIADVARAALAEFRVRHPEPPRLAVFGNSLGGAAALAAAADLGIDRVVVAACFVDMLRMARRTVGWPLHQVLRHRFDNVASLEQLERRGARVTLLHGDRDGIIPVEQGRELAQRFPSVIEYIEIPSATHFDVLWREPEIVSRALDADS
ncbi:MAG: alpha/beta hydrolase [Planctomycetota bacterium]